MSRAATERAPHHHGRAELRWSDVLWSSDRLHVRQSLQRRQKLLDQNTEQIAAPKTARGVRAVPILPLLRPHLEPHKRAYARPNKLDLVLPSDTGGPLDSSNVVNRVYLPSVKRAGLHRIRFHDLRYTFVTYCAAAGVPLAKVGDWVGHSDSRITEVYRPRLRRLRLRAPGLVEWEGAHPYSRRDSLTLALGLRTVL